MYFYNLFKQNKSLLIIILIFVNYIGIYFILENGNDEKK